MTTHSFQIEGPLHGYTTTTKKGKRYSKRFHAYAAWKDHVRFVGNVAEIPDTIPEDQEVRLEVYVSWKKKAKIDLLNVVKGIEDSLWGEDRRVAQHNSRRFEYQGEEFVKVAVTYRRRPCEK